jgi:hypothetical protein
MRRREFIAALGGAAAWRCSMRVSTRSASSLDILAHLSVIIGLESEVFGRSDANEQG